MNETPTPIDAPANGLRERKKRRTRQELVQAALRLFAERGFDRVTVEDIAAEVEVSPRTVFRYFASKEDILLAEIDEFLGAIRVELASRPTGESPLEAVRASISALLWRYEAERESMLVRAEIMADSPALQMHSLGRQVQWEQAIAEILAVRLGTYGLEDVRPPLIAACAVAALRAAASVWMAGGATPLPELVDQTFDLVEHGLGDRGSGGQVRA